MSIKKDTKKEIISKFATNKKDTGSAQVQIAVLSERITNLTEHFKLKSKDENLPDDKKLNFDIWYNPESNLIIKVSYSKMGNWEYRLKNFE